MYNEVLQSFFVAWEPSESRWSVLLALKLEQKRLKNIWYVFLLQVFIDPILDKVLAIKYCDIRRVSDIFHFDQMRSFNSASSYNSSLFSWAWALRYSLSLIICLRIVQWFFNKVLETKLVCISILVRNENKDWKRDFNAINFRIVDESGWIRLFTAWNH